MRRARGSELIGPSCQSGRRPCLRRAARSMCCWRPADSTHRPLTRSRGSSPTTTALCGTTQETARAAMAACGRTNGSDEPEAGSPVFRVRTVPAWTKDPRNFLKGRTGIGNVIARAEIDHEVDVPIRQRERVNVGMKQLAVDRRGLDSPGGLVQQRGVRISAEHPSGTQPPAQFD